MAGFVSPALMSVFFGMRLTSSRREADKALSLSAECAESLLTTERLLPAVNADDPEFIVL